jgi:hypothetical protein
VHTKGDVDAGKTDGAVYAHLQTSAAQPDEHGVLSQHVLRQAHLFAPSANGKGGGGGGGDWGDVEVSVLRPVLVAHGKFSGVESKQVEGGM